MNVPTYLPSKSRYEILDGLRGVAALIVLAYHHFDLYNMGNPVHAIINHGYLAVDFFFILSGFVIGYAYDDRWNKMSLKDFFKRRLVRLHPMIVFATLVGMVFFYFGRGDMFPLITDTSVAMLLICAVLSILMIPTPTSMDIRGWGEINAINGIVLFPVLVAMGAGSPVSGKSAKVCKFLGDISYPLYIVQYPIVYTLLGAWTKANPDASVGQTIFINVSVFLFSIFVAYASLKIYDEPVRKWLSEKWLKRKKTSKGV